MTELLSSVCSSASTQIDVKLYNLFMKLYSPSLSSILLLFHLPDPHSESVSFPS
jgi:hypothetical protein